LISQFKQTSSKAGAVHCIEIPQVQGISCLERSLSLIDALTQINTQTKRKKTLESDAKSCIKLQVFACPSPKDEADAESRMPVFHNPEPPPPLLRLAAPIYLGTPDLLRDSRQL
jgi:hypothetical protein